MSLFSPAEEDVLVLAYQLRPLIAAHGINGFERAAKIAVLLACVREASAREDQIGDLTTGSVREAS